MIQTGGATIIYQQNFDSLIAGSSLVGQAGFTGGNHDVVDQGGGDYAAAGRISAGGQWAGVTAPLGSTVSTGWVWTSFTLESNSSDTRRGSAVALVNGPDVSDGGNWAQNHVSFAGLAQWQLRAVPANASNTGVTTNAPDSIIGAVNVDTGTAYMWVNPDGTDQFDPADGGTADATLIDSKFEGPFDHLFLTGRNAATSSPTYDDIIVATTSADVGLVTVPEPSTLLLGGLGLLALLRRRRG